MKYTIIIIILLMTWIKRPLNTEIYSIKGLDMSKYQKDALAHIDSTISFVYLKCTEGVTLKDPTYIKKYTQLKNEKIVVGSYHFFSTTTDILKQVDFFVSQAKLARGDITPALDVEVCYKDNKKSIADSVSLFINLFKEKTGKNIFIYTYEAFYNYYLYKSFDKYKWLWIAAYDHPPNLVNNDWIIWQWDDKGVDKNIFFGNKKQFLECLLK